MNDLERYFHANTGNLIHKWHHFFEIYERHFARFRGQPVHMLEIGVYQGGSLQMWKDYFGPQAHIYGVDINPACRELEEDRVNIFIGDQEDRAFLRSVADAMPRIDIVLDDGGHMMSQLRCTFEELYPRVDRNGVYMAEDLLTCYRREFGGGMGASASFIEYSKGLIDQLHAWHSQQPARLAVNDFTRSTHSLHFYDSVLAIEKRPIEPPMHSKTGTARLPEYRPPHGPGSPLKRALRSFAGR
ncbi:MAG: class I SAM-dependent methyltransferase [Methylibium sp.]|nr:class I SAM-dependent methyltransferase [Methylibium sp.]